MTFPINKDQEFAIRDSLLLIQPDYLSNSQRNVALLVAGTVTIFDDRIRRNSVAQVTYKSLSNAGILQAECFDGSLLITSNNPLDAGTVYFTVFF